MTIAMTAGLFTALDLQVAHAMHNAWQPGLHGLFQLIAELGVQAAAPALLSSERALVKDQLASR